MADVFISYAKANQPAVRRLAEAVKGLGYSVWWDEELPPHLSYSDVIADRIGAARAAIVVWSEAAVASQWVRAEADMARLQNKLVQTSIDARMPPMPFNQIQFAAIGDWRGEQDHHGWMKVKASLEVLAGLRAAIAPPPVRTAPAAPGGSRLAAVLAGLLILAMLIAFYLFWERAAPPPAPEAVPARPAPVAVPPPPAAALALRPAPQAAPPAPKQSARPQRGELRRYCFGPGRGTAQCRELRARYGRRR